MTPLNTSPTSILRSLALAAAAAALVAACGGSATPAGSSAPPSGAPATTATTGASADTAPPGASEAPAGAGTTTGDIPDTAVFLAYEDASHGFTIQYVEGWQVSTRPDGVDIRDKDSSETVTVVPAQSDIAGYIARTDLPALESAAGFELVARDSVATPAGTYLHVRYHVPTPPDPVTGKQVPSTVDRYYVPGASGLAIVSLATPDGVDNVDAFRQMIESFRWK